MRLKGKVAIVTGAARGIGRAAAHRFAQEGAKVVLVDLNASLGSKTAIELQEAGFDVNFIECDVTSAEQIEKVMSETERQYGTPNILLNNAAIHRNIDFLKMTEAEFDQIIRCNLNSVFLFSQAVARRLVAAEKSGSIVNVSSINARMSSATAAAYSASKGGVSALTAAAALALADKGVRVNAIAPGSISTEMAAASNARPDLVASTLSRIPLGRLGEPEEIAALACFLASDDASYITGQTIFADGGRTALSLVVRKADQA